jgi:hypothetical protein
VFCIWRNSKKSGIFLAIEPMDQEAKNSFKTWVTVLNLDSLGGIRQGPIWVDSGHSAP